MTGITASRIRNPNIHFLQKNVKSCEERYPEMCENINRLHFEERLKIMEHVVEEVSEVDEEFAGSSSCALSTLNSESRSPYALPAEDRILRNSPKFKSSFFIQSVTGSKILRDSANFHVPLFHHLSEFGVRQRRLHYALRERHGSLDQISNYLLNLPPIPESAPVQIFDEK